MSKQSKAAKLKAVSAAQATVNVRLSTSLKIGGEQVLEREGVSVSDMVRRLYAHLERTQEIPQYLTRDGEKSADQRLEERRKILQGLVGVSKNELTFEQVRDNRLERQLRAGIS